MIPSTRRGARRVCSLGPFTAGSGIDFCSLINKETKLASRGAADCQRLKHKVKHSLALRPTLVQKRLRGNCCIWVSYRHPGEKMLYPSDRTVKVFGHKDDTKAHNSEDKNTLSRRWLCVKVVLLGWKPKGFRKQAVVLKTQRCLFINVLQFCFGLTFFWFRSFIKLS